MDFQIIYSKRRTVSLMVNREGQVVVRAPKHAPLRFIENLIEQRRNWIQKALEHQSKNKPKQFVEGELFLYLGKEYPLHVVDGYRSRVVFEDAFYISQVKLPQAKKLFQDWYKQQAKEILLERVKYYSDLLDVQFKKITIRDTSSRWGSCSSSGSINFSYRLVMAPLEILDYVVIHELAHTKHHNHSKEFWGMVGEYCPDYYQKRKWLHGNGNSLKV
jgi:predicted metal-dependent hydrolase